jgi:hypothetical protein
VAAGKWRVDLRELADPADLAVFLESPNTFRLS